MNIRERDSGRTTGYCSVTAWMWKQRPDLGVVYATDKSRARFEFKRLIPKPPHRNIGAAINLNETHRLPVGARVEKVKP